MLPPLISDVRDGYILDWWGIDEDSPEFSRLSENIKKPFAGARNAVSYKLQRPLPDPRPDQSGGRTLQLPVFAQSHGVGGAFGVESDTPGRHLTGGWVLHSSFAAA